MKYRPIRYCMGILFGLGLILGTLLIEFNAGSSHLYNQGIIISIISGIGWLIWGIRINTHTWNRS